MEDKEKKPGKVRKNPDIIGSNRFSHGVYSKEFRLEYYGDESTEEGKKIAFVMKGLQKDLGGVENLKAAEELLLMMLRPKIVTIMIIGDYIDKQKEVIDKKGSLPLVLSRDYCRFSESIRRDLELLFSLKRHNRGGSKPYTQEVNDLWGKKE